MEEAFRAHLLATAGIAAIVERRVDWGMRKQGDPVSAIALHVISDIPDLTLAGASHWNVARVQADCWGRTFKAARDLGNLLALPVARGGLHGFRGSISDIRFRIFVLDRDTGTDEDSAGPIHKSQVDLRIFYSS
ncbi:DUF3168 domain-containing protein [Sphingomonas sp. Leaf242]|uniref:DUF3168 domain-containing protein n=1 Tax=Sphingomonas sp. Leaf242 TaxID=1736304 RepID=UPI0007158462|nr:DUF3168 domain-containing protein [Sphingomonas sp. Leaf242]KQO13279.1 hypothetical protein ASF09_03250 [Sphingomonas sp. Leaf242]